MNDIDREDTKPIKVLSEINDEPMTRVKKNSDIDNESSVSRSEKYKDVDEEVLETTEEEKAEEALAEKNIEEAEALLAEEKKEDEETEEPAKEENSEKGIKKLITKFKALPKGAKIGIIIGIIILIIGIIVGILLLTKKDNKVEEKQPDVIEEAPVIVDNFYYKNGYLYFLDDSENEIGSYECANKDADLCYVAFNNYRDSFDSAATVDQDGIDVPQRMPIFNDNYVFINDNSNEKDEKVVMYSITSGKEIDTYKTVKSYDSGYIVYSSLSNNQYGLLKIEGDSVSDLIKPIYNYLGMIDGREEILALSSKGYVLINDRGKELSSPLASNLEIKQYSDSLIVAKSGGDYSVYNYKGDLLADSYTFATVVDNYMGLVDSNNKLYIRDFENNKMNEEGISLKNKEYVLTYVYNEDNSLDKAKQSFSLELKDEVLAVAIYPSDFKDPNYTNLDYNIIYTNKKYNMMNYFDGKLYFYKDEGKTELIGSYTCNNKNTIGNNNELTSCNVAKEASYEDNESYTNTLNKDFTIPMIHNRFVFIGDGKGTTVLYDLADNKTLGTYESVSTYVDSIDSKFTNVDKDIVFTALNKKGKYGMVSLTSSGASAKIRFDYNKLEKFSNNYILAQNSENKWLLIYGNTDSTSVAYDYKIQKITSDKAYFKVGSGDKYYIYNATGAKVVNSDFKYINMYPTYFIGVNSSNELYLYDYTGKKLTNEAIKVNGTSCSIGEFATATISGNSYTINYCSNGSSYETKKIDNTPISDPKKEEPKEEEKEQ